VLILEAWRRTGLRGLILVEKAGLAKQWRERAQEHLGVEAGMIGEGEWEERNLTVAMLQTLHRREIGDEWFRRWGFTALDEAHHARADTYQAVLRRVVSRYVVGVTATPLEGMWEQPLLTQHDRADLPHHLARRAAPPGQAGHADGPPRAHRLALGAPERAREEPRRPQGDLPPRHQGSSSRRETRGHHRAERSSTSRRRALSSSSPSASPTSTGSASRWSSAATRARST
jgi:hypothetical protein